MAAAVPLQRESGDEAHCENVNFEWLHLFFLLRKCQAGITSEKHKAWLESGK